MQIFDWLNKAVQERGLNFLMIGGHAINAYGIGRQTIDLDLMIPADDGAAWKDLLEQAGYELFHEQSAFVQFKAPVGSWPVDLMLVDRSTFERIRVRARSVDLGGGRTVKVPVIEHLLAMKLHALKSGQAERELKDMLDILGLIRVGKVDIEAQDFKKLCEKQGPEGVYEKIQGHFR